METTRVFQNLYTAAPRSHRRSEVASEGVAKHEYEVTDEDWERIEDESKDNRVEPGRNLLPYRRVRHPELVRGHWPIENNLHGCLDVQYDDDACRVRKGHGPVNLAALKRMTLNMVDRSTPQASTPPKAERTTLKSRRFLCGPFDNYLIRTLTGGNPGSMSSP